MKKPSLRQTARILGISAAYLSLLTAGKREWPQKLKQRYEEFVNIFVNIIDERTEEAATENTNIERENNSGGAGETRTLYLFNAIEALSRVSYSPIMGAVVVGALSRLSFSPKERTRAGALSQYSKRASCPQPPKAAL